MNASRLTLGKVRDTLRSRTSCLFLALSSLSLVVLRDPFISLLRFPS